MGAYQYPRPPCVVSRARISTTRRPLLVQAKKGRWIDSSTASPPTELLFDDIEAKGRLESLSLEPQVRKRAEEAIEKCGGRVTTGDVAAAGSLSLAEADEALKALAADALATLQVSNSGDIVYVFPRNFGAKIRGKSLLLRAEPVVEGIVNFATYLSRVVFGTALITSLVTVTLALIVISSSKDDRNSRGSGGGAYYGDRGPRIWFDLTDILWYWDPFYNSRRASIRAAKGPDPGMSFLEAIFSFVFGDGNPNEDFERRRWQRLGAYIQSRGGVVTAEEMAPYLDVTPEQVAEERRLGIIVDESFVLPALTRLKGSPEVDAEGNIVYRFPMLQTTAQAATSRLQPSGAFESRWTLTKASTGQRVGVIALGFINFVGVSLLTLALRSPESMVSLARGGMGWVLGTMPLLQAYALSFFVVPAIRYLLNSQRNSGIDRRNTARKMSLEVLQRPTQDLIAKLQGAERQAERRVVTERDVVYRTDRGVDEQPSDMEARMWNRRFEQRQREGR